MAPILGIWTPNLIPNWGFVNPSKEYFIKFELFSSPKGRECNQEKAKIFKRHTYATRPPPPPSPPPLQPLIPAYTLFQNGDDFVILLYLCCLALDDWIPARNVFEFSRSIQASRAN